MATQGSKTFQYLEEKKPNGIPLVAASEEGKAQTWTMSSLPALLSGGRGVETESVAAFSGSYKSYQ